MLTENRAKHWILCDVVTCYNLGLKNNFMLVYVDAIQKEINICFSISLAFPY